MQTSKEQKRNHFFDMIETLREAERIVYDLKPKESLKQNNVTFIKNEDNGFCKFKDIIISISNEKPATFGVYKDKKCLYKGKDFVKIQDTLLNNATENDINKFFKDTQLKLKHFI